MEKLQLNFELPYGTCDTHHHIFNPEKFKPVTSPFTETGMYNWETNPQPHTAEEYKELMNATGITHNIIVATSAYGYDVQSDLHALEILGKETTRAILWFKPNITDKQMEEWHKKGVRGTRAYRMFADKGEDYKKLAPRLAELGWCLDFTFASAQEFYESYDYLNALPGNIILSHQAAVTDIHDKAFPLLLKLMQKENVWVKLSAIYRHTNSPTFDNNIEVSKALIKAQSERLLWGTDWPHNWSDLIPAIVSNNQELGHDTGTLFKLLPEQMNDEKIRNQILAENPARLFGFNITN